MGKDRANIFLSQYRISENYFRILDAFFKFLLVSKKISAVRKLQHKNFQGKRSKMNILTSVSPRVHSTIRVNHFDFLSQRTRGDALTVFKILKQLLTMAVSAFFSTKKHVFYCFKFVNKFFKYSGKFEYKI